MFGGVSHPQKLETPPKNFCRSGNYNLNIEAKK